MMERVARAWAWLHCPFCGYLMPFHANPCPWIEGEERDALGEARRLLGVHRASCLGPPCERCERLEAQVAALQKNAR